MSIRLIIAFFDTPSICIGILAFLFYDILVTPITKASAAERKAIMRQRLHHTLCTCIEVEACS